MRLLCGDAASPAVFFVAFLSGLRRAGIRRHEPTQQGDDEKLGGAWLALPAVRRCGHARPATVASAASVIVPGFGRHGARAACRHAEPRDDRRAGCVGLARRGDDFAAAAVRAVPRIDRLPSDNHRSELGWKRVPFMFRGSMVQFGGLAIMPFALLVLSGRRCEPCAGMDRRSGGRWLGIPAGRRGPAYDADRRGLRSPRISRPPNRSPRSSA